MLSPVIAELAEDFESRAKVGKLNTDDNPEVPAGLRISAIPTVLFFKDAKVVEGLHGGVWAGPVHLDRDRETLTTPSACSP